MANPSNTDGLSEFLAGVFGFLMGAILTGSIVSGGVNAAWRDSAIKRGYAEFNSKTGAWQWKELKPESESK